MSLFYPKETDFEREPDGTASRPARRRGLLWMSLGLVYLVVWPLSEIARGHLSGVRVVFSLLALISYVTAFFAITISHFPWREGTSRLTWALLATIAVMSIVYPIAFGKDWAGMPIYLSVAAAMTVPPRLAGPGVIAATVTTLVLCAGLGAPGATVALLTFEAFTIGVMMIAFRGSRTLVVKLREARGEVARLAATEERLRIARDLHDLLGQSLSLIVLKSEVAVRLSGREPAQSLQEVTDIGSVARQALADVRGTVSGYRRRTLIDELDNARSVLAAADIELTLHTSGLPLPAPLDGLFGWAVREAVTNVVRHSRAERCHITVSYGEDGATLGVVDDGLGSATSSGDGNGLAGLAERAAEAGGEVESGPRPGGGYGLFVRAPAAELTTGNSRDR